MQEEKQLIPKLRFSNFNESWKRIFLGDIGKVTMCKRIMKDQTKELGDIPFYKIGTFGKVANAYISKEIYNDYIKKYSHPKKGEILIAASGATYGKTVVFDGTDSYFQDSNIVWIANNEYLVYNEFLNLCYQRIRWAIEESTIPRLYNNTIRSTKLNIPSLSEQQKIANFLTAIDAQIQTLEKKKTLLEQYKKGIMQKIFKQELRFKDENGNAFPEWKEKKLGDILVEVNEKTTVSNQYTILSSTAKGLFNQSDYFTRDIASKDNTGYKILRKEQLVFSPQNLWLGNININCDFEVGIVSPSYKIFDFNKKLTSFNFCKYLLFTNRMFFEYAQASEQGASVVRRNLDMSSFKTIPIKLPSIKEQSKIANFLSTIDENIALVNTKIEHTKAYKKGLLQQMFV